MKAVKSLKFNLLALSLPNDPIVNKSFAPVGAEELLYPFFPVAYATG